MAAVLACAALAGCNKEPAHQPPAALAQQANERFATLTAACTQFLAGRDAHVAPLNSPATTMGATGATGSAGAVNPADAGSAAANAASAPPSGAAQSWAKTGYSPAQVQPEVSATESTVTPFVGKLVIKDNEARATAPTEAEAQAITLTPTHLLSNRTHTLVYSFDGTQWHWQNGQRLTKTPGQNDVMVGLTHAEVSAPGPAGFAGCLPKNP
jgi:hypothetical protein